MSEATVDAIIGAEAPETAAVLDHSRSPLNQVRILLPVWGYRFVCQFLDFMLPTLLAPGNIPAVVKELPCELVLLTSPEDEFLIREHHAWRALARICDVDVQLIDDLITDGNHSTTITLAYARAIRQTGDAMLDTCFILLVSDYLLADGALAHVLKCMRTGVSGVLAGNFQIVAEDAIPLLRQHLDPAEIDLALSPRELMKWTLAHLHPATTANIVNYRVSHNAHTNRLFWRVDQNTLIGRFYLMHMVGIRPEVTDFIIGSSCDYSFIPEMCPSNNVHVIADSDDYLVVEMQPRDHEARHLRWGPIDPKNLAVSLSEWTTVRHRENVQHTLIYHSEETPAGLAEMKAESDAFVERVGRDLSPVPQPHRNHHYWIGAIAAHRVATGQALTSDDWKFLLGETGPPRGGVTGLMWRARFAVFGTPPRVAPWHPRWPDFDPVLKSLERLCSNTDELLVLSNSPRAFAQWLAERRQSGTSLEIARLLGYSRRQYLPLVGKFAVCFLFLTEGDLKECDEIIRRVGPLLKPGGHLLIVASNDQTGDARVFAESFAYHSGRFVNLPLWVSEQRYVEVSKLRWRVHQHMMRVGRAAAERPRHLLPFYLAAGGGLTVLSYFCNRSVRSSPEPPAGAGCSSVFMVLRAPEDSSSVPLPRFTIEREANRMPLSKRGPSEDRFVALRSERGLESLGLMANQAWHDDPRQLGFVLARYRFIAGLLNGRHDVGEVGCGDAFGTRIVLGEVKKVTVYDSNPIFIDDVHRRYREEWPLDAHVHDILREPLSRKHDSIYSMDAIQHVPPEEEDTFVRHLRDSLSSDHDLVIVGGPSQEHAGSFDRDASAAIYRRGGSKIKALMERYFHAVFMFSMVGEAVFSGTVPGAHHFFALCCGRK